MSIEWWPQVQENRFRKDCARSPVPCWIHFFKKKKKTKNIRKTGNLGMLMQSWDMKREQLDQCILITFLIGTFINGFKIILMLTSDFITLIKWSLVNGMMIATIEWMHFTSKDWISYSRLSWKQISFESTQVYRDWFNFVLYEWSAQPNTVGNNM